jgi:predicted nucleic acid-binding protein
MVPTTAGSSHKINFVREELIIDVPQDMEPAQWPECCIYRVPKRLRQINNEAYTPKLISIGPFHHGKDELKEMEMLKVRYFKDFWYRTGKCQKDLASVIKDNEVKIRHCYAENFDINSEDFVKMVLLDSAFIIELFLRADAGEYKNDYILSKPWLSNNIKEDLILLENQLPLFILKELFSMSEKNKNISFLELARGYLNHDDKEEHAEKEVKHAEKEEQAKKEVKHAEKEVKHFTDLKRYYYCPSDRKTGKVISDLYNATKLYEAGVIFKMAKNEGLLNINFHQPSHLEKCPCFSCSWLLSCLPCLDWFHCLERTQTFLKVPCLEVEDSTECLFRNLMALEQCHYLLKAYICNYFVLLDYLIDTREDVELLVGKKIMLRFYLKSIYMLDCIRIAMLGINI